MPDEETTGAAVWIRPTLTGRILGLLAVCASSALMIAGCLSLLALLEG